MNAVLHCCYFIIFYSPFKPNSLLQMSVCSICQLMSTICWQGILYCAFSWIVPSCASSLHTENHIVNGVAECHVCHQKLLRERHCYVIRNMESLNKSQKMFSTLPDTYKHFFRSESLPYFTMTVKSNLMYLSIKGSGCRRSNLVHDQLTSSFSPAA